MNAAQPAIWKCLLTGGLAGFVNGFFGAGGGMIVVPLLILLVKLEDKNAFSSAISIILPLTIVSLVIYAKNGALDLKAALPYLLGGAAPPPVKITFPLFSSSIRSRSELSRSLTNSCACCRTI